MKLKYEINQSRYEITFCKKKKLNVISSSIDKIKSDKNILITYDEKINKKIFSEIYDELKSSGCKIHLFKCSGDKINKNERFLFKIIDILLKEKFTKKSILISLGGGVVSDVSALAAGLYLRGLYYFNIPSTMTAIVDSCVGGKTAINYRGITNLIGTYYHPNNIFILEDLIKIIPDREFFAGFAEIIKCGIIDNKKILSFLLKNREKILLRDYSTISKICVLTLRSKIKFFSKDVYENNQRLFLNLGHTFAHAIEMAIENELKKDYIRHGEAVGLGILCEIFYGNRKKNFLYKLTENLLNKFNLPTKLILKEIPIDPIKLKNNIYKNIFLDKKKINKYPRYIYLKKQGKPKIEEIKDFDFLNDTIFQLIN